MHFLPWWALVACLAAGAVAAYVLLVALIRKRFLVRVQAGLLLAVASGRRLFRCGDEGPVRPTRPGRERKDHVSFVP